MLGDMASAPLWHGLIPGGADGANDGGDGIRMIATCDQSFLMTVRHRW